jgi:hypothetical protein
MNEVEEILSATLMQGLAFRSLIETNGVKTKQVAFVPLQDELSDIIGDLAGFEEVAETSSLPATATDPGRGTSSCRLIHRRPPSKTISSHNSLITNLGCQNPPRSRNRTGSSRNSRSRSRRSRRQYVIPENAIYKCPNPYPLTVAKGTRASGVVCTQPKTKNTSDPALTKAPPSLLDPEWRNNCPNFYFGTEGLEKLGSIFIQPSNKFCGNLFGCE